jgi:hypothetical protein
MTMPKSLRSPPRTSSTRCSACSSDDRAPSRPQLGEVAVAFCGTERQQLCNAWPRCVSDTRAANHSAQEVRHER